MNLIITVSFFRRCPDDESILIVSSYNKAFSQSFENLLDDTNFNFVQVRGLSCDNEVF